MLAVTILVLLSLEHLLFPAFVWWDKPQHALAFAVLTAEARLLQPWAFVHAMFGILLFGAAIKLAQWAVEWAVEWRFAGWTELAADGLVCFWLST